jgi:hypothetical protein
MSSRASRSAVAAPMPEVLLQRLQGEPIDDRPELRLHPVVRDRLSCLPATRAASTATATS